MKILEDQWAKLEPTIAGPEGLPPAAVAFGKSCFFLGASRAMASLGGAKSPTEAAGVMALIATECAEYNAAEAEKARAATTGPQHTGGR